MKNISLAVILFTFLLSCSQKNDSDEFSISGKVNMAYNDYVNLYDYVDGDFIIVDSVNAHNGVFEFHGSIEMPELRYIGLTDGEDTYKFFIENAEMIMNFDVDSIENTKLTGSASHDLFTDFQMKKLRFSKQLEKVYKEYREADKDNQELIDSIDKVYDIIDTEQKAFINTFIQEHNNSVVSPYLVRRHLIYAIELAELEKLTASFDLSLAQSKYTKWLFSRIELLRKVDIGKPFTDFSQNDIDGNPFSLSQLKGNVILIDFWASWCGPCRRENPNVVKIYEKYHNQGFDILGVSFDKDYDKWLDAINEDKLTWNHVSDLQGWGNTAGKQYGVMSIPHTVIIDKEGNIAAKNLRGDELEEKIKELL